MAAISLNIHAPVFVPACRRDPALRANLELLTLYETYGTDFLNSKGETLLHLASEMGDVAWVNYLLFLGCSPLAQSECGNTPLHTAAKNNQPAIVHILAAAIKKLGGSIDPQNSVAVPPSVLAVLNNSKEALEALLAEGADINHTDERGMNLLHIAITSDATESALCLIQKGINTNLPDAVKNTPLHYAAQSGQMVVALALLRKGATLAANKYGFNQAHLAAMYGHTTLLDLFFWAGFDLNEITFEGKTPIYLAAEYGHDKTCSYLLAKEVETRVDPKYHLIPLLILVITNNLDSTASSLIPLKIDLTQATEEGAFPLEYAYENRHISRLLIKHGGVPEAIKEKILYTISCIDSIDLLKAVEEHDPTLLHTIFEDGETLYSVAHSRQSEKILAYLTPDNYSRFIVEVKQLAAISGLAGSIQIGTQKVELEGSEPHIFYKLCSEQLMRDYPTLQLAFSEAGKTSRQLEEVYDSILSGKVTVIPCGWQRHCTSLVLKGDVMIICNRGARISGVPSMKAFVIDRTKICIELLDILLESTFREREIGEVFLYETLPECIASSSSDAPLRQAQLQAMLNAITAKNQSCGNCSAASVKTAMRAALFIEMYEENPLSVPLDRIKTISKQLTAGLRETAERRCMALARSLPGYSYTIEYLVGLSVAKRILKRLAE